MMNRFSFGLVTILVCTPAAAQSPQEKTEGNLAIWQEMVERNMKRWRDTANRTMPGISANCQISGKTNGLDAALRNRLCGMSRALGPVTVVSGCRKHGSRRSPRSYHKYSRGCKAADVVISGVKRSAIKRYWAANGGGGTGTYRNKRIVHVDVGPSRSWHW